MADSDCKPKQKATKSNKKKRKVTATTVEEHEQQKRRSKSKGPLIEDPKDDKEVSQTRKLELQGSSPWRNLQLVLPLQNKHVQLPMLDSLSVPLSRTQLRVGKVELAHDYVKSELGKEADDTSQEKETVSISRVILFLNNWVQSLLISSEKEIRVEGLSETARSCLDYKCWEIFKFCLEESLKWHVSLSFSRDFLRVINCIARDIWSELTAASAHPEARNLGGEKLELYTTVLNCISFVFSCHEGISNENLDLWVLTVESVLELLQKVVVDKLDGGKAGIFAMQFSCAVLEPFTKFLRVHPARKDGFRGFINKLLEPLLQLMDLLRLYGSNPGRTRNLLKHLFDKLEKIMAGKNALSLGGVGELFRLYVDCVREHKGVSVRAGGCDKHLEDDLTGHVFKNSIGSNGVDTGKRHCSSGLNAETRKSVFDFFVQIMEPLLLEMDAYLQADLQVGPMLLDRQLPDVADTRYPVGFGYRVSATSGNAGKVDLSSPPNWSEVLNALTNRSITVSDNNDVLHDGSCGTEQITNSFKKIDMKPCMEQKFFPSVIVEFTSCQNLLNFLSWIPKGYQTSQSITIYATCILNLERSAVLSCVESQRIFSCVDVFKIVNVMSEGLKNLLMAASDERMEARKSPHASTVFRSSFSVLWLLKSLSAVIELQHAYTEDGPSQVKDMTFSLIDHTSYVFLTLSRDRFLHATRFVKYTGEKPNVPVFHKKGDLTEVDPCLISSEDSIDAWEGVFQLAETLREQTQKLLIPLEEVQVSDGIHGCKKLSSVISCFQGLLWGLSSALNQLDAESRDLKIKSFNCKFEPICKVNLCIDTFAKFVSNFLCGLFLDDFTLPQSLSEAQALPLLEFNGNFVGVKGSSPEGPLDVRDNSSKRVRRKRFRSDNAFPDDIFAKVELFDRQCIKMALLRGFLRGISECLLSAFVDKVEVPQPFSFVWMDGIVMFLEEIGNHFPLMNPNLSRNLYVKMINLHLIAIGICIALQGKGATLASHETDSSIKTLGREMKLSESTLSHGVYCLNEFKARLRRSCTVYIKKPSELHLLSAVQAVERALVGVSDGCTTNYDICTGGSDGGKVSKIVAAGIDCLDLVLEFVEGRKRLSVVDRHIQSLVACLFNIILHLQGPKIFCHNVSLCRGDADPDPGSITLMCVEVLTRVCGKHAFFQWDTSYVAQSLRMPAALFQNFLELGISDAATKFNSLKFSEIFHRQFSMDLYAACCRLLFTVLKHHKRESQQCIALLEDSVSVLLHCLETVDIDQTVGRGHPTWQVQEGVKCACSLRRIYEEIRQQKDVLGQHSFQFLSSYIWIYSGYGPLRSGIRREIDEALRPGVYALIDACSPDDLQHIHTVFGVFLCDDMNVDV
ncbi:hypothetical protein RJ639_021464 [Escallonia herrerae]|uniref:Nucleolar 27S pre-rRNA processing Urb2/Npa2 C-terminal domain-containing protein n=1 Tax=Escallonia herrerae TaxID=1293975 RepID=A0AA88V394_9ASTE|nr:hypothetical protein RJ639_021464 [Escallonia herrerae]